MSEPEAPRNANRILLAAFTALLAGGGSIAVVALLAKDVLA